MAPTLVGQISIISKFFLFFLSPAPQRLFWAASLAVANVVAFYFVSQILAKWHREPVYVAFDTVSTPVWELPFPAVTVCNMNQVGGRGGKGGRDWLGWGGGGGGKLFTVQTLLNLIN